MGESQRKSIWCVTSETVVDNLHDPFPSWHEQHVPEVASGDGFRELVHVVEVIFGHPS
jgi:hypothetical protein